MEAVDVKKLQASNLFGDTAPLPGLHSRVGVAPLPSRRVGRLLASVQQSPGASKRIILTSFRLCCVQFRIDGLCFVFKFRSEHRIPNAVIDAEVSAFESIRWSCNGPTAQETTRKELSIQTYFIIRLAFSNIDAPKNKRSSNLFFFILEEDLRKGECSISQSIRVRRSCCF